MRTYGVRTWNVFVSARILSGFIVLTANVAATAVLHVWWLMLCHFFFFSFCVAAFGRDALCNVLSVIAVAEMLPMPFCWLLPGFFRVLFGVLWQQYTGEFTRKEARSTTAIKPTRTTKCVRKRDSRACANYDDDARARVQ